jgi:hypothetical protein
MKNAVFWDIKSQFVPHRKHMSPLQSPPGQCYVRFEVFTVMTMKNAVFWDVTPCGSCKDRRYGGTYRFHHQSDKHRRTRNNVSSNYQPTHAARKYLRVGEVTPSAVPATHDGCYSESM